MQVHDIQSVEKAAVDYWIKTGCVPKYVLMDSLSYKMYCRILKPKEKLTFAEGSRKDPGKITTHHGVEFTFGILSVETDDYLFEVV